MKAELEKAKEATRGEILEQKFYDLRAKENEVCLTDKLARVCRDYCLEVWTEALNLTGVPAILEWRRAENVYCPQDL